MRKKHVLLLIIFNLFIIFAAKPIIANSISLQNKGEHLKIQEWREKDLIKDFNLIVDATYTLKIKKNFTTFGVLSLDFSPGEFVGSKETKPAKNFQVMLCKDRECNQRLYALSIEPTSNEYPTYKITIFQKKLDWEPHRLEELYYLRISYILPKYIEGSKIDSERIIIIGTGCQPKNLCPTSKDITKNIRLPPNTVIISLTEKGVVEGFGIYGLREVEWNDFESDNHLDYQEKKITYLDRDAQYKFFILNLILSAFIGAIIGAIIAIPFDIWISRHYYKKSKNDNQSEFLKLKETLKSKMRFIYKRKGNPKKKIDFEKIYPHVWNQYEFLVNQRQKLNETIYYLLALINLILIVYLQLYNKKVQSNPIFLIPVLFLFGFPIVLFFWNFIPKNLYVPFTSKENLKEIYHSKRDFYEQFIRDIYGVVPHISEYRNFKRRIVRLLLNSLYAGLVSIILLPLIENKKYFEFLIVLVTGIVLMVYLNKNFWRLEYIKKGGTDIGKENEDFFNDWLKKF